MPTRDWERQPLASPRPRSSRVGQGEQTYDSSAAENSRRSVWSPPADLWPAQSWSRAKAKRMWSTPPAHSLIQARAKKRKQLNITSICLCLYLLLNLLSVNCLIHSRKRMLSPIVFFLALLLSRSTGAKDPTFGGSFECARKQAKFINPETFSRQQLSIKCKSSDPRGGSSWGHWGFDLSTKAATLLKSPWKPDAVNAKRWLTISFCNTWTF